MPNFAYFCIMIFYFSATGNTKWAARKLANATNEQLVSIPEVIDTNCHFSLGSDERLGFMFPIHGWRVPLIVRKFIQKLTLDTDGDEHKSIFSYAVCTAGDDIGLAIEDYLIKDIQQNMNLNRVGITGIDSAYSLIMPESYVGLPFMDVDTKENEIKKKTASSERLNVICEEVFDKKKGVFRLDHGGIPWMKSKIIGGFFTKHLITDKAFRVDSDRCVKCGICANVCPTKNINGGKGQEPVWNHTGNCLACFNCYHHCPHHAIEYGNRTKHKGQYFYK